MVRSIGRRGKGSLGLDMQYDDRGVVSVYNDEVSVG